MAMNAVKKFSTLEELKSSEKKTMDYTVSLKKHSDFEKAIKHVYAVKANKGNNPNNVSGR